MPLLPTGTSRSLRDIVHWQPARGRFQFDRLLPRGRVAIRTPGRLPRLPDAYIPNVWPDAEFHAEQDLRDKVHAHTDAASGRSTSTEAATKEGDVVGVQRREQWLPLPREALPRLIAHFERQRNRFRSEAASIHIRLHGLALIGPSDDADLNRGAEI
jgi:hypothetical protein